MKPTETYSPISSDLPITYPRSRFIRDIDRSKHAAFAAGLGIGSLVTSALWLWLTWGAT